MRFFALLTSLLVCSLMGFSQTVTTLIPSGSGIDDMLFRASNGKIYGSGFDNGHLYVIDGGQVSLVTDTLRNANGIAEDSGGNLFVADHLPGRIWKISPFGKITHFANISRPSGIIKMPDSDTLLVTGYTNHRIYKLAPDGNITVWLQGGLLSGPVGLTYDEHNTLYIGNFTNGRILKVDSTGTLSTVVAIPGGNLGFVIYSRGFLYATMFQSHKIYKIFPETGLFTLYAGSFPGSVDGPLATATFNGPNGVLASSTGDSLYISDYHTKSIRLITGLTTALEPTMWQDLEVRFPTVVETDNWSLDITVSSASSPTLQIHDLAGRIVYSTNISLHPGNNHLSISPSLSAGVHFLTISDGERRFVQKFVKK